MWPRLLPPAHPPHLPGEISSGWKEQESAQELLPGCGGAGPAHSLGCFESLQDRRVPCYWRASGVTIWAHPQTGHQPPRHKLCAPRSCPAPAGVTPGWYRADQCHVPIPAALVTDQLQHLLRIHYLLPGFASSFSSRHFDSVYLLPVREGNRTDPWGDGEREEGEINPAHRSTASPPR